MINVLSGLASFDGFSAEFGPFLSPRSWWFAGKLVFKFIYLCFFFFFGYTGSSLLPGVFSSCDSLAVVHRLLLTAVASLGAEHGLYLQASVLAAHGLSSCGTRA